MNESRAVLVLEDGATFEGKPFGKTGRAFGETVFYTGVVGYQELITNPSYGRTLAVLTYPIIGSYGVNDDDMESGDAHVGGLVIRDYSPYFSNFRAEGALEDFLVSRGVVGIADVDTRAVAVHLREHGEMKGAIVSGSFDAGRLVEELAGMSSPFEEDLSGDIASAKSLEPAGAEKLRVAVLDLGAKRSLLAQLGDLGCAARVCPASAGVEELLSDDPAVAVVAGGPGDPRAADRGLALVRVLVGKLPVFGIGLGHQLLALALGCKVKRMATGHHGINYPVKSLDGGPSLITEQHHSFVVDDADVPASVELTYLNLNDGTIEGIRSRESEAWSVQFHPSRDEMERPSPLLKRFCEDAGMR